MAAFSKGHKKVGGRKAGVPNRSTVQARELAKIAERKGLTPLDILLGNAERFYQLALDAQANDKSEDEIIYRGLARENADKAAPYCHQKLSTMTVDCKQETPTVSRVERVIVYPTLRIPNS
jgi:hypothetical protein